MSRLETIIPDDEIDMPADAEIRKCLDLDTPKSFFLFAGAGSGKTRSLVSALQYVRDTFGDELRLKGQRVAVITYTNAASEEIQRRLDFDPTIDVSTIHSFAWSLIEGLNRDIREWLRAKITTDITKLEAEEAKGRKGTEASRTRLKKIASRTKRLQNLDNVKRFVYSPTGENLGRDSLNHTEVIHLTAYFLTTKPTMQNILIGRNPILLIDESQDTNKFLIEALFAVQAQHKETFVLGLIGDMMQRIYSDGKDGLDKNLPADWATPGKQMNHRCPKRIVKLINTVRSAVDKQIQRPRTNSLEGSVRLFVLPNHTVDKPAAERKIAMYMAEVADDEQWRNLALCKCLTLEHHMAASRLGFLELFAPLYSVKSWRTNLIDGSLPCVRFFTDEMLPLIQAKFAEDRFSIARILKKRSSLVSPDALQYAADQRSQLKLASAAMERLMALFAQGSDPSLGDVLRFVADSALLPIPESLQLCIASDNTLPSVTPYVDESDADHQSERTMAIGEFLLAPFSQVEKFASYVSGKAPFDTHQGVKGLEFERVMVIMDDEEARGFMFKYENLFGAKSVTDPSVEAVRRLFYVTCSRAQQSLALVAYAASPEQVRRFVMDQGWFNADEIVIGIPE